MDKSGKSVSSQLSLVAEFDDLIRIVNYGVASDVKLNTHFKHFLKFHEQCRFKWQEAVLECRRLQSEMDKSAETLADLENRLYCAKKMLDQEKKIRHKYERESETMRNKMDALRDFMEREMPSEANSRFMETLSRTTMDPLPTRKSERLLHTINENSTGTLLSDLSLTQSEDDIDISMRRNKRRSDRFSKDNDVQKKLRLSEERDHNKSVKVVEVGENDRVVATTTLTMQRGGPMTATSVIEAIPPTDDRNTIKSVTNNAENNDYVDYTPMKDEKEQPNPGSKRKTNLDSPLTGRQHKFVSKNAMRPERCCYCSNRIFFGKTHYKCKECRAIVHVECRSSLPVPCVPCKNSPSLAKNMQMFKLDDFAPSVAPMIPALIIHCVNEIEARGLDELGLYRIPGSELDVNVLRKKFLQERGLPNLKSAQTAVLCGTVKSFLRSLNEPLVTHALWTQFRDAARITDENEARQALIECVKQLPPANRDTLAFLILHLQRISENPQCKMPLTNLAKVFAPTIIGFSAPDPHDILSETVVQFEVLFKIIQIPESFWTTFINRYDLTPTDRKLSKQPSTETLKTPKYRFFSKDSASSLTKTPKNFFTNTPRN